MISGIHGNECSLTPKVLKKRGIDEKGVNNIKNMIMFSFCMTILLRGVRTKPLRKGTMIV